MTQNVTFPCTGCGKTLKVNAQLAGKTARCPVCGNTTVIPHQAAAPSSDVATMPVSIGMEQTGETQALPGGAKGLNEGNIQSLGPPAEDSPWHFLAPPIEPDEIGRLGSYRVLKVLGVGGMGVVFQAEDPHLKRSVALKAMLPSLSASPSAKKRFLREAQAAAAVKHDHVVSIYHVGEDRGVPFLAMEFLEGEPLDKCLKRQPVLPNPDLLRIGREIAEGLAAAHARGLVHRDIKPANIWLEGTGPAQEKLAGHTGSLAPRPARVKILDFGLARAASEESGLTQQGAVIGTPAYMAPEQARGESVNERCDLFSLGVVLYRMGTGTAPFLGNDTVATLVAVATQAPLHPSRLNPSLPGEVCDLIMGLLEKDATKRIGSATEVIRILSSLEQTATSGSPTRGQEDSSRARSAPCPTDQSKTEGMPGELSAPTVAISRSRLSPPRRAAILAIIGVLALLGLGAATVFFWQTPDGIVRIETDDPNIKLAIDGSEFKIVGAYKEPLTLTPGKHGLRIKKGEDFEFNTDKLVITKGDKVTLRVEVIQGKLQVVSNGRVIDAKNLPLQAMQNGPVPAEANRPPGPSEIGIRDFAEVHDADETRFDAWIAKMKKDGYRPVNLSVQTVKDSPRYTAVAVQDNKNWPWDFSHVHDDDRGAVGKALDRFWAKKYQAVSQAMYRERGKTYFAFLWARDDSIDNSGHWMGNLPFVQSKIKAAKTDKDRLLAIAAAFEGVEPAYSVLLEEADGVPWMESINLSLPTLKEWTEKNAPNGWRLDQFVYYGVGAKRLFAGILVKDPNNIESAISWSLTPQEYDKELSVRRRQGFRPLTTVGHEDAAGSQRFSAVWIRYRAPSAQGVPAP